MSRNAAGRPAHAGARARAGWGALLVSALARGALVLLTGLLLWSVAPAAAGWSSSVVMSDSMAPRLLTGDVVLVRPVEPGELRVGQILLVDDPDHPGRLRLHRLAGMDLNTGVLTLKGDANPRADSTPVHTDAVHGVAALRVPWVGSPLAWLREGRLRLLAAMAAALAGLAAGAWCYRPLPAPGPAARRRRQPSHGIGTSGDLVRLPPEGDAVRLQGRTVCADTTAGRPLGRVADRDDAPPRTDRSDTVPLWEWPDPDHRLSVSSSPAD